MGRTILLSIADALDSYSFASKDGKDAFYEKEMDREVFVYHQSWLFSFTDNMNEVLFPILTSDWRVNNFVSRRVKGI